MRKIFLKPAQGLNVPDPAMGGYLPEGGAEVDDSPYWRRLLKYKNVFVASAPEGGAGKPADPAADAVDPGEGDAGAAKSQKDKAKKKK
jgi:hypothetical protein